MSERGQHHGYRRSNKLRGAKNMAIDNGMIPYVIHKLLTIWNEIINEIVEDNNGISYMVESESLGDDSHSASDIVSMSERVH